ncbi:MAG: putative toxin-antitoxin system toxin component, PIN family [Nanoarchaeota archaeon]
MGKKKVLLDTNILISALGWSGKPKELFRKCLDRELELITSIKQLEELHRVMNYPKFNFSEEQKDLFLSIIMEVATFVETSGKVKRIKEDPDDDIILETALVGNAEYIISGDPHLLNIKTFTGIKIVTAAEFLDIYQKEHD